MRLVPLADTTTAATCAASLAHNISFAVLVGLRRSTSLALPVSSASPLVIPRAPRASGAPTNAAITRFSFGVRKGRNREQCSCKSHASRRRRRLSLLVGLPTAYR